MTEEEKYMFRCLELAQLGAGRVAPNPMVGALLVHEGRIIGEGYHQHYGEPHAEVNCLASVTKEDAHLVDKSTLFVSLEPCAHFGKTPPCADLIVQKKIPRVVVGCRDPFQEVNGKGIERMRQAGIDVAVGILETACEELNKRFLTFHNRHRPYVILKWAQSMNARIGNSDFSRVRISNAYSDRLVHKWRSEEAAILVGTNTALHDNPSLTTRLWKGKNPLRLVIDLDLRLPMHLNLFDGSVPTIVFNTLKHEEEGMVQYYQVTRDVNIVHQLLNALWRNKIQSVLVEGGSRLLQSFIDDGSWDEARVITNTNLHLPGGLPAPLLGEAKLNATEQIQEDLLHWYLPK